MNDIEQEQGVPREHAVAIARGMLWIETSLRLPALDRPLIELAAATAGRWQYVPTLEGLKPVGFDLVAIDVVARWLGVTIDRWLHDGLRIIEAEALRLMQERS